MQQFIGTKVINAKPMNLADYNILRGWELPSDQDGTDEGFLVEYLDGGQANVAGYLGYVSWSPKEVFENSYNESGSLTFGDALVILKAGGKVARAGWNGKGMFVFLDTPPNRDEPFSCTDPYVSMFTAQGTFQPGWLCSQADMLASDWCAVD